MSSSDPREGGYMGPVDDGDPAAENPEYVETLHRQLNRCCVNLLGLVEWFKVSAGDHYEVRLRKRVLHQELVALAKGSHSGIWLKEILNDVFPDATPMVDAGQHLGICHPEKVYISVPAIIVESLHAFVERGQATGSFLRSCLENDFIGAGGRADHINGTALPEIAKYIFNELPPDSFGTIAQVAGWLELSDDDRKEYLKNWRDPEHKND